MAFIYYVKLYKIHFCCAAQRELVVSVSSVLVSVKKTPKTDCVFHSSVDSPIRIKVEVAGIFNTALYDTGSSYNFVSSVFLKELDCISGVS